jgi:LAS superfamily LD-carboxypeptidase LdcB
MVLVVFRIFLPLLLGIALLLIGLPTHAAEKKTASSTSTPKTKITSKATATSAAKAFPAMTPSPDSTPWVVLSDHLIPYQSASLTAEHVGKPLAYPLEFAGDVVKNTLTPGGKWCGSAWIEGVIKGQRVYLPMAYVIPKTSVPPKENLPIGKEEVDREHALPHEYMASDMEVLPLKWQSDPKREAKLRKEAADAAVKLFEAAEKETMVLRIVSGYRSFETQRKLYLSKIEKTKDLNQNVVAKPGHSEHQLGTAMDISGLDIKTQLVQSFANTPEGRWVKENCKKFGFRLSYTPENEKESGYIAEPWHLRYMGTCQ